MFTAPGQEIVTANYTNKESRATLVVAGPVADGKGHTTAVDGTCANCNYVRLIHVQVRSRRIGVYHRDS